MLLNIKNINKIILLHYLVKKKQPSEHRFNALLAAFLRENSITPSPVEFPLSSTMT